MLPTTDSASTVLVTGASSGIGQQLALALARRGYNLTIVARRDNRLSDLAAEVSTKYGVEVTVLKCDLSVSTEVAELVDRVTNGDKKVVGLVNNAGFGSVGPFISRPLASQRNQIAVNIDALLTLTHQLVQPMVKRGYGAVLNVASVAAFQPIPAMATYAASKAFVLSFSNALQSEVKDAGVSVTTLCPGTTRGTEFGAHAGVKSSDPTVLSRFLLSADEVAERGVKGMLAGDRIVVPGLLNRATATLGAITPRPLVLRTLKRFGAERITRATNNPS